MLGQVGRSPHLRRERVTLVSAGHLEDVRKCLYWPWVVSAMALKYRVNLSSQILETQAPPQPLTPLPTIHKAGVPIHASGWGGEKRVTRKDSPTPSPPTEG